MGQKSEYLLGLIDEEITYPEAVIEALKEFKKCHKMNQPDKSFDLITAERTNGMMELLDKFVTAYQLQVIGFAVRDIVPGGFSGCSYFLSHERRIVMVGKLSIITFLHEFGHALLGNNETDVVKWSINLFKRVYPIAFEKLHNPESHVLVSNDGIGTFVERNASPVEVLTDSVEGLTGDDLSEREVE